MTHRTLGEWGYLPVEVAGEGAFTREHANRLIAVAKRTEIGGEEGARILTDHHSRLRAQQVVGVLAAPGCSLEILPKIEGLGDPEDKTKRTAIRERLIHMLGVVYDLDIAVGDATPLSSQNRTLLEILIGSFCRQLTDALREGMPRNYVGEADDLPALRGRLDVTRQVTTLAASPHRLACRYDALSPNIALNQVMRAAVDRLSRISHAPENQRRLRELGFVYADVAAVPARALAWDRIVLDRTNRRWRRLRDMARLLLRDDHQTTSRGRASGFSLLFAMNDLFEGYVARMLARGLQKQMPGLRVYAQDRSHHCLDDAGTPRFRVLPDIVVRDETGAAVLVIDTKWKRISPRIDNKRQGVSQADIYQMMAYGRLYHCPELMLLYPHHGELGGEGETGRYTVNGCGDILRTATIDVAKAQADERLARLCARIIRGDEPLAA